MRDESVILVNLLKVKPGKQEAQRSADEGLYPEDRRACEPELDNRLCCDERSPVTSAHGRTAMARMVVIYRTPRDIEAFDRHYFGIHVPLAKRIPGLRKYEVSDGAIATPVGTADVHRIGTLYFDDLAAIRRAFASPQGQAAGADRRLFAPDDSGVQMFLFDNREL